MGATIANDVIYPVQKTTVPNVKHTRTRDRRILNIRTNNNIGTTSSPYFDRDSDTDVNTSDYIRLDNNILWYGGTMLRSINPNIMA